MAAIDLVQAEAVADLIDAVTPLQARAAFDQLEGTLTDRIAAIESALFDITANSRPRSTFQTRDTTSWRQTKRLRQFVRSKSDIGMLLCDVRRGRLIREGARAVIAGKPNVGNRACSMRCFVRVARS